MGLCFALGKEDCEGNDICIGQRMAWHGHGVSGYNTQTMNVFDLFPLAVLSAVAWKSMQGLLGQHFVYNYV
jgi:hypothetical protein